MKRFPKVCKKKRNGYNDLFVSIRVESNDGKYRYEQVFFGREGTQEAEVRLSEFKVRWYQNNGIVKSVESNDTAMTVAGVAKNFMEYANAYYKNKSQPRTYFYTLKKLVEFCGGIQANKFDLAMLESYRSHIIDEGKLCRKSVNANISGVLRVFTRAAKLKQIPMTQLAELKLIEHIPKGITSLKDHEKVKPVPIDDVIKTTRYLSSVCADMVLIQLLTGARPSEIRTMRFCDVDTNTTNGCWRYTLAHDKTERFRDEGDRKIIPINKSAQDILSRYFTNDTKNSNNYVFINRIGNVVSMNGYYRAIQRAAIKAGVPRWHPYQLRHTAATEIYNSMGIDAAKTLLGHSLVNTTEIYVEKTIANAEAIANQFSIGGLNDRT